MYQTSPRSARTNQTDLNVRAQGGTNKGKRQSLTSKMILVMELGLSQVFLVRVQELVQEILRKVHAGRSTHLGKGKVCAAWEVLRGKSSILG